MRLRVDRCGDDFAETTVVIGGDLSDRKGVNVPNAVLPLSALTEKDRSDLAFALDLGVDWVALSFVQRPEDVAEARKLIAGRAGVLVSSRSRRRSAVSTRSSSSSDAVMVARGDLGVEMPPEDVPPMQKQIIHACRDGRQAGDRRDADARIRWSHSPSPTRAEASDVATAVYEGADAVMLSAETAAGSYPARGGGDDESHHRAASSTTDLFPEAWI